MIDDELDELRAEYRGWHIISRRICEPGECGTLKVLQASREPQRRYHVLAGDEEELRDSLDRFERHGSLVR
jgi:hypothetical protein